MLQFFNSSLDFEDKTTWLDKSSIDSVIFQIPTRVLSFGLIVRIIGIIKIVYYKSTTLKIKDYALAGIMETKDLLFFFFVNLTIPSTFA